MAINNGSDGMDIRITVDADAKTVRELKDEIGGLKNTATGSSGSVDKLGKSTKDLGKQSQQTGKDASNLSDSIKDAGKQSLVTVEHIKVLAAAFISLQAAQGVMSDLRFADDAVKTADRLGIAIEKLTALQYTAGLAGVDTASLGTSLQFLSKNAVEAAQGTGEAYDAFNRLGISVKDANGNLKSAETLIYEIADSLGSVKSESEQVNIAMAIFGRSGASMLNLLKMGADGVKAGMQDAFKNGGVVTEEFARKAEEANDALEMMHLSVVSVRREISAAAAPIITEFADEIRKTANELREFYQTAEGQEQIKALASTAKDLVLIIGDLAKAVAWLTETFGDALPWMVKAYIAMEAFGAVKGSIEGVGAVAGTLKGKIKDVGDVFDKMGTQTKTNTYTITKTVKDLSDGMGGLSGATKEVTNTYESLAFTTVSLGEKLILLRTILPATTTGWVGLAAATAIALYNIKSISEKVGEFAQRKVFDFMFGDESEKVNNDLKETEKQINLVIKERDKLMSMGKSELTEELNTATAAALNLELQLANARNSSKPAEDIKDLEERLKSVNEYIKTVGIIGGEGVKSIDDLTARSKILAEETKKTNEEYDKQADIRQKVFDISYRALALSGQQRAAQQLELQYYSSASQTATNYHNSNMWAINKQIGLFKDLASTGKGTYAQLDSAAQSIAQMIVDSSNRAKSALISNLETLTQRAQEAQSKMDEITSERKSLEESYAELVKNLRQTGMTEDQKAADNRKEVMRLEEQANTALAKSIVATDADTKEKLRKQGEEYLKRERDLALQVAQYYKSVGQYNNAKEIATYGDEAQDRLRQLNDEAASGAKKNLDTIKSSVEYVKSTIEAIDKNIQLTISETGLDAIRKAYADLKDKTITITTVQKSVQQRRWGGMVYGRLPGYGGGDKIPLLAEGGEFVHRKEAVSYYGAKLMDDINNMRISPERLMDAMNAVRPMYVPDLSGLPTMEQMNRMQAAYRGGGVTKPRDVVELVINVGGTELRTTADAEAYERFETIARRKRLCVPKKRTV